MNKRNLIVYLMLVVFMGTLIPNLVQAAPGDLLAAVAVPVPSPEGIGIGVAVNCEDPATIFYTNTYSPFLYKMDAAGNDLGSVALADAAAEHLVALPPDGASAGRASDAFGCSVERSQAEISIYGEHALVDAREDKLVETDLTESGMAIGHGNQKIF